MPLYDMSCEKCNREWVRYSKVDDRNLPCEECGGEVKQMFYPSRCCSVIGDDIPGGIVIRHGICNEDGTPRTYYSKSEMIAEAKRRGLENVVRHVPDNLDSDKSKHTVKWG